MTYVETVALLAQPLDPARIRHRDAGRGRQVPYLEGHDVIARANEVFGFDGWHYSVDEMTVSTTTVGRIFYRARVTVEALGVKRNDVGVGVVETDKQGTDHPVAHETAIKGAATDALKRALRSFGAQFGNELYDKTPQASQPTTRGGQPRSEKAQGASIENVGQLLDWARREYRMTRSQVLDILGTDDARKVTDVKIAARQVQAWVTERDSAVNAE